MLLFFCRGSFWLGFPVSRGLLDIVHPLATSLYLTHLAQTIRHALASFRCPVHHLEIEREREIFYLTTHSTHFIYGYMASDIWLRTILIVRKETRCRHIGYSYRLTARVLLYAPSHRHQLWSTGWNEK